MRSMARWVLPVLVGPSTAVTPAPRARPSRAAGDENEMAISFPGWGRPASAAGTPFCITMRRRRTGASPRLKLCERVRNESRPESADSQRCRASFTATCWIDPAAAKPQHRVVSDAPTLSSKTVSIVNARCESVTARESQAAHRSAAVDNLWITCGAGARAARIGATASSRPVDCGGARLRDRDELRRLHHAHADRRRNRRRGTAPARGCRRPARARPPCRAARPDT